MRPNRMEDRRGAALVLAIAVVLGIVIMVVGFLQSSITYSSMAVEDKVRAEAMAACETGFAMAYHRVRNSYPLENELLPDPAKTDGGREWNYGEVSGKADLQDGTPPSEYDVRVWWSILPKIEGQADAGSTDSQLVDADLKSTTRPEEWFPGKIISMVTGNLAGFELRIISFDKTTGTITFPTQKYTIAVDDDYEIPSGVEYLFESDGTYHEGSEGGQTLRQVETWWWKQERPLKKYAQRGAVVANSEVQVLGQMEIDGRDHCANGGKGFPDPDPASCPNSDDHHIVGPGVKGVSTTENVVQGGSAKIGGDGNAPVGQPNGLNYAEESYPNPVDDGTDNDGQGGSDEDPYNGLDDDRDATGELAPDGDRDEDMRYPDSPDEAMGVAEGTLKEIAQSTGTYFTTQKAFTDFMGAQPGNVLPGGRVYYLEVDKLSTGKIVADMTGTDDPANDPIDQKPIIFIVHKKNGSGDPIALVDSLYVHMKGLILVDYIDKINGQTRIVGGVQTLATDADIFGNGQAKIWYSSAVLANLPNNAVAATYHSSTWREKP